jgi:hypothetical protein
MSFPLEIARIQMEIAEIQLENSLNKCVAGTPKGAGYTRIDSRRRTLPIP